MLCSRVNDELLLQVFVGEGVLLRDLRVIGFLLLARSGGKIGGFCSWVGWEVGCASRDDVIMGEVMGFRCVLSLFN